MNYPYPQTYRRSSELNLEQRASFPFEGLGSGSWPWDTKGLVLQGMWGQVHLWEHNFLLSPPFLLPLMLWTPKKWRSQINKGVIHHCLLPRKNDQRTCVPTVERWAESNFSYFVHFGQWRGYFWTPWKTDCFHLELSHLDSLLLFIIEIDVFSNPKEILLRQDEKKHIKGHHTSACLIRCNVLHWLLPWTL